MLTGTGTTYFEVGCMVLVIDQVGYGERRAHPFNSSDDYAEEDFFGSDDPFAEPDEDLFGAPEDDFTEGGEFDAHLILFMPGLTGGRWFDNTDLPRSEGGLIRADHLCRVEGMERVYVAGDCGSFPGPEWMPKQAHMADLQAAAAAQNLAAELNGKYPEETFKVELICIVDSQTTGSLIARTGKHNLVLPQMRALHWLKKLSEWWYLRQYR